MLTAIRRWFFNKLAPDLPTPRELLPGPRFVVGNTVRIKGCPHVWTVYGYWPWGRTVHLQRWDNDKGEFIAMTFVDPDVLDKAD